MRSEECRGAQAEDPSRPPAGPAFGSRRICGIRARRAEFRSSHPYTHPDSGRHTGETIAHRAKTGGKITHQAHA